MRARTQRRGRRPGSGSAAVEFPLVEPTQESGGIIIYEPDNGTGEETDDIPPPYVPPPYSQGALTGRLVAVTGPNLAPNPGFEDDTSNWSAGPGGAAIWRFASDTESWATNGSTVAHDPDIYPIGDEAGSLLVTASASADYGASSPTGLSGKAVTVGNVYMGSLYVASSAELDAWARIHWYDNAGALLSTTEGATGALQVGEWTVLSVVGTAPTSAVYAAVAVLFDSATAGDYAYVSVAGLTSTGVATIARTTTAGEFSVGTAGLKVTSPAAGVCVARTPDGYIEVTEGEYIAVEFDFRQDDGRDVSTLVLFYDEDETLLGVASRGMAPPPNSITTWQTCSQTFRVPADATYMVVYVGFVAGAGSEILYVDYVSIKRCSLVTAAMIRTADTGPRVEVTGGPTGGQLDFYISSRVEDQPGTIHASPYTLVLESPHSPVDPLGYVPARLELISYENGGNLYFGGAAALGPTLYQMLPYGDQLGVSGGIIQLGETETSDVTSVGGTETDLVLMEDVRLDSTRTYEVKFWSNRLVGPGTGAFRVRLYIDGVEKLQRTLPSAGALENIDMWFHYTPAADGEVDIKVTLQRVGGAGTADVKADIMLSVIDIGASLLGPY